MNRGLNLALGPEMLDAATTLSTKVREENGLDQAAEFIHRTIER